MKKRVLVFSIALGGYDRLFASCIDTQRDYCRRHGYEYVLVDQAPRRLLPAEAAWLKISLILSALKAGYEWVAFIDADCDVRNNTPCFPEYLDRLEGDQSIFVASGFSGRINSGVVFAKNSAASVLFFQSVINHADQEVPREDRAPYENGHMIFHGKNSPDVYLLEHILWNNNSILDGRSYIQHYSGGKLRPGFMNKRAPAEFRSKPKDKIRRAIRKVIQRFRDMTPTPPDQKVSISASMDELTPYYKNQYPELHSARTNG